MARDLRVKPRTPMVGKKGYRVDEDSGIWEYGIPTGPSKGDTSGSGSYRDLGDWFEPPAGTLPTPGSWGGAGMQQNPGTFGIMDHSL